jgi:hypothetical protein
MTRLFEYDAQRWLPAWRNDQCQCCDFIRPASRTGARS